MYCSRAPAEVTACPKLAEDGRARTYKPVVMNAPKSDQSTKRPYHLQCLDNDVIMSPSVNVTVCTKLPLPRWRKPALASLPAGGNGNYFGEEVTRVALRLLECCCQLILVHSSSYYITPVQPSRTPLSALKQQPVPIYSANELPALEPDA